ncbi:glycoside hydrolase family 2 TIM barrel-domain containing protein [Amycolatopsis sp. CA-126428]|uniref:glycoside hydrolase family 2 TIM barrel-domain containing protein n=1 Tax=Amycolatopsis sp. CA-126428 TaxID=2073158 RepID=UPI001E51E60B|nr:glycoside hydrolase family 2 TIM barrel-domain containing protein [Amycolatopsis sp. CA-126428]
MRTNRREFLSAGVGLAGLSAMGGISGPPAAAARLTPATETMYLTGIDADHTVDWEFQCTRGRRSGVWGTIPTPSNWECQGYGTYNYGWNLEPEERGLYRYRFTPPAEWRGRQVFLVFEGAMTDTEVRINGSSVGSRHQGGFYRFRYDVTSLLLFGRANLLEATVSRESADESINNAERRGDFWNFSGIFRPVFLQALPAAHIERIAVDARADGSFTADVHLAGITAAGRVVGRLEKLDGTQASPEFSVSAAAGASVVTLRTAVPEPHLWTAETPNLYRVVFRLVDGSGSALHGVSERFGFRTIEVRIGDGVYLNGRKIILKGANRHTIWPTTGRASSPRLARADILLMKEMNMNAVRMSHYPPDTFFLDLCDELGLYVLDELAGWQKAYDEVPGAPLLASMVTRDVNHPSILFWDNGNEGGWNTALDDDFARFDPQRRTVLHPWANFGGINTDHYETYDSTRSILAGSAIFMPTEFLHGLYDGGGGAGLNDYWKLLGTAPRSAGGFLWAFVDEGVVRDDLGGVIDTAGNAAPDGILGPFREKEASFFTIKDIWSPVQLAVPEYYATTFPADFDRTVEVVNRYDFTSLNRCRFTWQLLIFAAPGSASPASKVRASGTLAGPDAAPGATGTLRLALPGDWAEADALRLSATDPSGREILDRTWPIKKAADHASKLVVPGYGRVTSTESGTDVTMTAGSTRVTISKNSGLLSSVMLAGRTVPLRNGPALAAGSATFVGLTRFRDGTGYVVEASYTGDLRSVRWRLDASGWLQLGYHYHRTGPHDFVGVNFDFPEANVRGLTWLGDGPYRVYRNRMRGVNPGVWTKAYNDTATGARGWQYPEFKGYHANTYWAALRTTQATITMVAEEEGLFLRLFTPAVGVNPMSATVPYPAGGISFLDAIPASGNKFHTAAQLGPESQSAVAVGDYRRTLYFRFSD